MLVDEAVIIVRGGHGGPGRVSFHRPPQRGPDGGNGGRGGDVYLQATTDLMALRPYTVKKTIQAENGEAGDSNRKFGSDGKDISIPIPVGARLVDTKTGEEIEITDTDQRILIAKGGLGGKGNYEFRSSTNTTPMYAQPGLEGEEKELEIVLRLIADYGLIGLPNAGKSSLLNELTAANVKTAAYPFTTLEPNLGVLDDKILADIPGLIEGASDGKGLGIKFLKHIEKTKVLLHCISLESDDVLRDYKTVRAEIEKYSKDLTDKEEIILLTKTDMVDEQKAKSEKRKMEKLKRKVLLVSIHDFDSLMELKKQLTP